MSLCFTLDCCWGPANLCIHAAALDIAGLDYRRCDSGTQNPPPPPLLPAGLSLPFSVLRRFHLRKMNLTSVEVQTALRQLGKLDAFLVEDCTLGAEAFKQLEEVLRSCSELSFIRCPLGALPPGLTELAPRALRFRNCKLDADALSEMSTAVRARPELGAVELLAALPGAGAEGEGPAPSLVSQRMALNLLALDLSENHLAGAGRTMALLLRYCHQLALLQLEDCGLSLEDLTLLCRALARSRVERLDLAGNNLRR
ncbi:der, partial [Symbiodinium necroappetens]